MFYHISLEHEILLHPRYFGPQLLETVKQKLFTEVEGTCTGKYGFVIAVTTIDNIGAGLIQPGRGFVVYPVKYKAIVFRPFKGEVLDAVVTQVNKVGLFTEIGPLSCFISRHSIPSDMQFDPNSNPPCYKTPDDVSLEEGGLNSCTQLKLEAANKAKQKTPATTTPPSDDREDDLSPVPNLAPAQRVRRGAVSAETYSEEDATTYVKKERDTLFGKASESKYDTS
ncbi:DNA-directed RNA polymerase II subunit RPB7-like [Centruroides sculpturatus]|uniref:DNA-directed RNA polymerase II subunit RPB7-like n=1 Tax=Centruroides sculpturatus TaxID=218467 RepID=UPI000C6D0C0D|nr:DNA-directed RNA polymerase II subunit RPB7-like [Centruroides sculpturatus]